MEFSPNPNSAGPTLKVSFASHLALGERRMVLPMEHEIQGLGSSGCTLATQSCGHPTVPDTQEEILMCLGIPASAENISFTPSFWLERSLPPARFSWPCHLLSAWEHQCKISIYIPNIRITRTHIGYVPSIQRRSCGCTSWCKHRRFQLWAPDWRGIGVCKCSCSALHQEQNPLGMGTVFTELSYFFILGAQFLLSQSYLSESPNLYCSAPQLIVITFAYMIYRHRGI